MSPHGRTIVATASALAILMCCARMAGGLCSKSLENKGPKGLLSLFGQEYPTPPTHPPEYATAKAFAVGVPIPNAAPVPPGFGSPALAGGVHQKDNL